MDWRTSETNGMTKLWTGEGPNRRTAEIDGLENERNQRNEEILDGRTSETDGMKKFWTGERANRRTDEMIDE
jgi:hypothetical protein